MKETVKSFSAVWSLYHRVRQLVRRRCGEDETQTGGVEGPYEFPCDVREEKLKLEQFMSILQNFFPLLINIITKFGLSARVHYVNRSHLKY